MAISFVGANTITGASGSGNIAVPAGTTSGDLLILIMQQELSSISIAGVTPGFSSAGATNSGWKEFKSMFATGTNTVIFYKFAASASEPTVNYSLSGSAGEGVITMLAYRGVIAINPQVGAFTGTTTTSAATNTLNTVFSDEVVLSVFSISDVNNTWTTVTPGTSRVLVQPSTANHGMVVQENTQSTPGISSAVTASISGSATLINRIQFSLIPDTVTNTRFWFGGSATWGSASFSDTRPIVLGNASCTGTTLTTTGSPSLAIGMTVRSSTNVSLGTISSGSGNSWQVSVGGTYSAQLMTAATTGASVPTSTTNVFFGDYSSAAAYTVTTSSAIACLNFMAIGSIGGTATFSFMSPTTFSISGSWSSASSGVAFTTAGGTTVNFISTATGRTIDTNGIALGTLTTGFNGIGGGWTLRSVLSTSGTITVVAGALNTNGFAVAASSFNHGISSTSTRSVTLGTSTITLSGTSTAWTFDIPNQTGLTFSGASSTINLTGTSPTFNGGGLTYGNVNFTSTALVSPFIAADNVFTNLTIAGRTTVGIAQVTIGGNQTISGTLSVNSGATASAYRVALFSDILSSRTLTCGAVSLTDVDLRDINFAGAVSLPVTGTRLGNCGGNANVTFSASKTVYYRQTGSANWGATGTGSWSATSGGALDATMFPLAQDIAIFPADTYPASGSTTTINAAYSIGSVDMSLRTTNTMTLSLSVGIGFYSDWTNGSGITLTGGNSKQAFGRGLQRYTSAGKVPPATIIVNSLSGTFQLQDALTVSAITLASGTIDLQSFTLTLTGNFNASGSTARTIAFGTGNIVCSGTGTVWNNGTITNLTVTGTPLVVCTNSSATSRTITPGTLSEANSISFRVTAGTGALTLTAGSYRDLDFTDGTNPTGYAGAMSYGTSFVYGSLKFSTNMTTITSATNTLTFASTSGTKTINTAGMVTNRPFTFNGVGGTWVLQNPLVTGNTRTVTLTAGTLNLGSYALTTGFFNSTGSAVRNLTTGGVPITITGNSGVVVNIGTTGNLTADVAPTFNLTDAGSTGTRTVSYGAQAGTIAYSPNINVTAGTDTFTTSGTTTLRNLDFTGFTGTFGNATREIYGNLTLVSGMALASGALVTTFNGVSSHTITSAGKTFDNPIVFDGVGGTWQLQDPLTVSPTYSTTLTRGTLDINGTGLTTGALISSNSNTRTLKWGPADGSQGTASSQSSTASTPGYGAIFLTSANNTTLELSNPTNMTMIGSKAVITYGVTSDVETRYFNLPLVSNGATEAHAINLILGGSGPYSFWDNVILPATTSVIGLAEFYSTGLAPTLTCGPLNIYGNFYSYFEFNQNAISGTGPFNFKNGGNITTNGSYIPFPVNIDAGTANTRIMYSAMTLNQQGANGIFTLISGNLYQNGSSLTCDKFYSANNTNTRTITPNGGNIYTGYGTSAGGNGHIAWDTSNSTNLTYPSGRPNVYSTYSPAGYIRKFAVTGADDRVNLYISGTEADFIQPIAPFHVDNYYVGYYIDSPVPFYGTLNNVETTIYGNLQLGYGAYGNYPAGANTWTFADTSLITTYYANTAWPFLVSGSSVTIDNSYGLNAKSITHTAGYLNFSTAPVYLESFSSTSGSYRTINFSSGYVVLTGTGNVWDVEPYGGYGSLIVNRHFTSSQYGGTTYDGYIQLTGNTATFNGGDHSYSFLEVDGANANTITLTGSNLFKQVIWNGSSTGTLKFDAGVTTTLESGIDNNAANLTISSNSPGTQATLYFPIASGSYYGYLGNPTILKDIAATNSAPGSSGINFAVAGSYSLGNVTGWTFDGGSGAMMFFL